MNIYQAIQNKDFELAKELLESQSEAFNDLKPYEKNGIIQKSLSSKKFDILEILIDQGFIELDFYEVDRWLDSFLHEVLVHIPFVLQPKGFGANRSVETDLEALDQEALVFFEKVCFQIENIDEVIERQTLLEYAISKNTPIPVLDIIVKAGCSAAWMDASENTLLFKKLQVPVVEWLLGQGLHVNHQNKGQETPLIKAILNDQVDVVKVLLDHGADITYKNKDGNSVFHMALVDKASFELFDMLCEYDQPNVEELNNSGSSLLFNYLERMYSVSSKEIGYLEKLLNMGGDVLQVNKTIYGVSKSPLDLALSKGFDVFEALLMHYQEDINQTDDNGNTLLHKACAYSLNFDQNKAKEIYKIVKLLLSKGADITLRNTDDKTAMELAMDDNLKEKIVALLLKKS